MRARQKASASMDMEERVARKVHAILQLKGPSWDEARRVDRDIAFWIARAAIEAMREPTKEMAQEGFDVFDFDESLEASAEDFHMRVCERVYRAMVDAALSPTPSAKVGITA